MSTGNDYFNAFNFFVIKAPSFQIILQNAISRASKSGRTDKKLCSLLLFRQIFPEPAGHMPALQTEVFSFIDIDMRIIRLPQLPVKPLVFLQNIFICFPGH